MRKMNDSKTPHRKNLLNGIKKIKIKGSNLNIAQIIILLALFIIMLSLINPWISLDYNNNSYWAFSKIIWIVWYLSIIVIVINCFIIFSTLLKQKIKFLLNTSIKDSQIFIWSSLILFIIWIQITLSLEGLQIFSSQITFHSWIILYLLWSFLFLSGSFVNKKLQKSSTETFLTNNSTNEPLLNTKKEKNITKLPF